MENMGAQPVYEVGGRGTDDGFMGGGGMWVFFLFFLLAWGGNGFGGFGGNNAANGALTRAELNDGFAFNNVDDKLDGITNGICNSTHSVINAINGVNSNMSNGFCSVERGQAELGYKMQNCCCETNRNIDSLRYENAKNTCDIITNANLNTRDIIDAGRANTQRLVDIATDNKIEALRTDLQTAQLKLSQADQTAALVDQLKPCPIPSYVVANPFCPITTA